MFSCDIAYSDNPAASRAFSRSGTPGRERGRREASRPHEAVSTSTPLARPRPWDQRKDLVAVHSQLLGLDSKVLEGLVLVLEEAQHRVLPSGTASGWNPSILGFSPSMRVKSPCQVGIVDPAHDLHVLLRHRLLRKPGGGETHARGPSSGRASSTLPPRTWNRFAPFIGMSPTSSPLALPRPLKCISTSTRSSSRARQSSASTRNSSQALRPRATPPPLPPAQSSFRASGRRRKRTQSRGAPTRRR